MGAREVMEEEITPYQVPIVSWGPCGPAALPEADVRYIAKALVSAKEPLLITGYSGRNHDAVNALTELANTVKGLRVLDTGACDMCFPADHPGWLGMRYGSDPSIQTADLILVVDCDVPWIPTQCRPKESAHIIHIDIDPLKKLMPLFYLPTMRRYAADSFTALSQILTYINSTSDLQSTLSSPAYDERWNSLQAQHQELLSELDKRCEPVPDSSSFNTSYLCRVLKALVPSDTIYAIEAVTNSVLVADQIRPTKPGQWINCGGGGLGWSGGGALGIKLAVDTLSSADKSSSKAKPMVVQIVGDGTFLFSVPSSVYWISHRYQIPILTIVLNNKGKFPPWYNNRSGSLTNHNVFTGWNAPRRSMLLVHPDGLGSKVSNGELNISFDPSPDYSGIARAASDGNIHAARVSDRDKLQSVLEEAIEVVQNGTSAVIDVHVV